MEELEEFKEVKNLDELIKYMYKQKEDDTYYMYVLKYIGYDGLEFEGKIIYVGRDGEENTVFENRTMRLIDLFNDRAYLGEFEKYK